jgi:iron(III) transport system permease protein
MIGRLRTGEATFVAAVLLLLATFLVAPVATLGLQAFSSEAGGFTFAVVQRYLATPGLTRSLCNTAILALGVVAVIVPAAFGAAYALERTRLPFRTTLQAIFSAPLLIPSLLPALALVYLFGRQGLLTPLFGGHTIYGAQGVLIADAIAAFPHALIILRTALSAADGRLYEQASLLGSGRWRTFWRITLPNVRHGLVSAAVVVFSLTIADVGAPKVVGGDFDVLALDIYKAVLGRQDFQLGAAAALFLLAPSVVAVVIERLAARRQAALVSARSTPFAPKRNVARDAGLGFLCGFIGLIIMAVFGVCQWAALVRVWPYDLSLSLDQYRLDRFDGGGWSALTDSILLGVATAVLGTASGFAGAYAAERSRANKGLRGTLSAVALAPAAVPGLALGLAYVLFFNDPANPMHAIYGTFALLVVATVIHFYTVAHLTCVAALRSLDPEFELAGAVLGKSRLALAAQVIAPLSAPALVEVAVYLFVGAMTTVSAVVFLYPPDVKLASVAVLNMDDAGDTAPAAAMGMLIVYVNVVVRAGGLWLRAHLVRRTAGVSA